MKIITLLPFRNEEHFLKTCLTSVSEITDEIICINDKSTDNSKQVALELGAKVYDNTEKNEFGSIENQVRESLLNLGREANGTHFIFLDADEALTSNLKFNLSIINDLKPGQSIELLWMAIWKSLKRYKTDNSVWSNNFKDFIYCDDPSESFIKKEFDNPDYKKYDVAWPTHPTRTPSKNKIRHDIEKGAVLHYQFSNWEAFQLKQAWYRCSELIQNDGKKHDEINSKYKITLEESNYLNDFKNIFKTSKIPSYLFDDVHQPDLEKIYNQSAWRLNQIQKWFDTFGKEYFQDLDIWHLDNIKKL